MKQTLLIIPLCLLSFNCWAAHAYHDFRDPQPNAEVVKMQDFHLQNAALKLQQQELSYAWGDLAYVLCNIPNHHVALEKMSELATQLHKEKEMKNFFTKAIDLYPEDDVLQQLYKKFLTKSTNKTIPLVSSIPAVQR